MRRDRHQILAARQEWSLLAAVLCSIVVGLLLGNRPLRLVGQGAFPDVADDAFYYFGVASHLATSGRSTFDGQVLTNGYHPLWQFMLALQYLLVGPSIAATLLIQLAATMLAAFLVFRVMGDWVWFPLIAVMIVGSTRLMAVSGMETAILLLMFSLFVPALRDACRSDGEPWFEMAVVGALVIAARLDAAFFVLPALIIVPSRLRQGLKSIVLVGCCGALYAIANRLVFGAWMPVSGSVKSLGGLGLNRAFLDQLSGQWHASSSIILALLDFAPSLDGRLIATTLAAIALLALAYDRRRSFAWRFTAAMLLGLAGFLAKVLFFSSWMLWPWYYFPSFFLLVANFLLVIPILQEPAGNGWRKAAVVFVIALWGVLSISVAVAAMMFAWLALWLLDLRAPNGRLLLVRRIGMAIVGICIVGIAMDRVMANKQEPDPYLLASQALAEKTRKVIGAVHVGMGDRSGAFSYYYGGPVTQLEGLSNDADYFHALAEHRSVQELLCARGVQYIVDFEADLGAYDVHLLQLLNPLTTSFAGPTLQVAKADEIARIADPVFLRLYPKDGYVYVWRLSGCKSL